MPLNDLYAITTLDHSGNVITSELNVNAVHAVFEGHFPGAPVLPGVVQLEMVKSVLGEAFGRSWQMREMSSCKFLEVFNPAEISGITIHIQYKGDEALDVTASGKHGERTFFKARATFLPTY